MQATAVRSRSVSDIVEIARRAHEAAMREPPDYSAMNALFEAREVQD